MASSSTLILAAAAVLLAGATTGLTGFGFSLVATPLLILALPAKTVVPVLACLALVQCTLMWYQLRRSVHTSQIWIMTLAALIGVPLGTYLLLYLDADVLKVLIGSSSVLAAVALMFGFRFPVAQSGATMAAVGLLGGLLGGTTGMSGPPVVVFLTNQGVRKEVFRANLSAYFVALSWVRIGSYAVGGLLSAEVLTLAALLMPAALVGLWTGLRLECRVDEVVFRRLTLLTLIATSLAVAASGLAQL